MCSVIYPAALSYGSAAVLQQMQRHGSNFLVTSWALIMAVAALTRLHYEAQDLH
jgi:hypothetical protein